MDGDEEESPLVCSSDARVPIRPAPQRRQPRRIGRSAGRWRPHCPRGPTGTALAGDHRELDAAGRFLSPPLVDPHVHMDAVLTVGEPR